MVIFMIKGLYLMVLFIAFMGIVGGIGYSIYSDAWYIAIGLVAAGYVAWPGAKELFQKLKE